MSNASPSSMPRWSLRHGLMVQFLLLALIPLSLIGAAMVEYLGREMRGEVEVDHQLLAKSVREQVNLFVQSPLLTLQGAVPYLQDQPMRRGNDVSAVLDRILERNPLIASLTLLGTENHPRAVGLPAAQRPFRSSYLGLELGHHAYVRMARELGQPVWSSTYLSVASGAVTIAVALPVDSELLVAEVNLARLSARVRELAGNRKDLLAIVVDEHGHVVAHPQIELSQQQANLTHLNIVQDWLDGHERTAEFVYQGEAYIGSIRHVEAFNWAVIVAQPLRQVLRTRDYAIELFIWGGGGALLLALILAVWLARRFGRRIDAFGRSMERISRGDFHAPLPRMREREFHELMDAFTRMQQGVADREQRLRESELLYREVVENTADLVVRLNPEGRFQYANYASQRLLGVTPRQCQGMSIMDFIPESEREWVRRLLASWREGHQDHVDWESRMQTADGVERQLSWSIGVLRDGEGGVKEFSGIARDLTEQRRSAEERLALETKLRQAQKMESVGHLAGGIAHDFNNILAAIIGYAELGELRAQEQDDEVANNYQTRIKAAGLRARDLVSQLLTYSRAGELNEETIHVEPVVKEVTKLLQSTFPATCRILVRLADEVAQVRISPVGLHQILMNLAINARFAMEDTGEVQIEVQEQDGYQGHCASCHQAFTGDYVSIAVRDTGCGMSEAQMGQIFDPFYTTKERGRGTGLGLSVTHGMVHGAGGHISLRSQPGEGSEFIIHLPREAAPGPGRPVLGQEAAREQVVESRVLLVDDESAITDYLAQILQRFGCQVEAFNDPRLALERFQQAPSEFDLMITDQTMPGLTGTELAQACLRRRADFPVILCTGYSTSVDEASALNQGVAKFLMKPVVSLDLVQAMIEVLPAKAPSHPS